MKQRNAYENDVAPSSLIILFSRFKLNDIRHFNFYNAKDADEAPSSLMLLY